MAGQTPKVNIANVRRFNDLPNAQQAGMLCNDEQFRTFAGQQLLSSKVQVSPTATAEFIRTHCSVSSRRDLNTDADAAHKFQTLRTESTHGLAASQPHDRRPRCHL